MKRTVKRILAILLTVVMLLSVAPLSVFAKENEPDIINNSQAEIKQTNSLSKILAEATDMSQVTMDSPYYISEMTFDSKTANVRYYNSEDCWLIVAVYDENTEQMLDSAITLVEAESVTTDISFKNDLPEHFLAKAFLIDENNASLCKELVCRTYTTEFEEMSSLTVDDFDEEKVVNFDDDKKNNFVVLADDVVTISGTKKTNVLSSSDVANNTYTLTDIDDSVRNLNVGDSFYLDNGDLEDFLAIKVKSITVNGSTAVIVAEDSEAEDLFECIKIDSVASAGQADYSSDNADEAVEYEGAVDYETEEAPIYTSSTEADVVDFSLSHKFKIKEKEYKNKNGKVEGKFSGGVTFKAKLGFTATFSGDYKDISFTIDPSIKVGVKVTGKIDILKINLGSLGCRPIPPLVIGIEPQFVVKVSGELSVNCEFKFTLGLGYNSKDGFINKCKKPTLDVDLKAEVTLFIGFDLQPHVALLSEHVAKITLSGEIGAEAKATMKNISPSELHSCSKCIDGDLTGKGKIGVKLTFGEDTFLEKEYEATLIDLSWKLGNFYYSISHNEFGFGSCPYILHKFTVKVTDKNGSPIKGATVKTDIKGDTGTATNSNGEAAIMAGCGEAKLTAEADGYKTVTRTVKVSEDTVKFYLKLKKAGEPSDGTGSNDSVFKGTESTGTIINFGSYPQSKVTDSAMIKNLEKQPKVWESYGYYSGTGSWYDGNMKPSDYMKYADIVFNGNKYRAVTFNEYRPDGTGSTSSSSNSYQDDNGYYKDNIYYFKYEPLKWKVLDANTGLVVCDSVIDSQPYNNYILETDDGYWNDSSKKYYASNWENSSLRLWLNNDFYNTAFSKTQQDRIQKLKRENKSTYNSKYDSNPTYDKITLLSYNDVLNKSYGFSSYPMDYSRCRKGTDYAKCQGLCVDLWWLLRSSNASANSAGVSDSGLALVYYANSRVNDNGGIVPALNFITCTSDHDKADVADSIFFGTETTGAVINFGSYPQSRVNDTVTINKLDGVAKNWKSYNYYSGTGDSDDGNMKPSDYMKYADIVFNGNKYRAVTFSEYRPNYTGNTSSLSNTYQDDNGYYTGNVYYFKYEPLKWRVLDASTGLVVCDSVIDSQAYNNYVLYSGGEYYGDSGKNHYASDWENSSLRKWLNEDFYNTAFSKLQQDRIKELVRKNKSTYYSKYDSNPTSDKVTLLSYDDLMNTSYGFSSSRFTLDIAKMHKGTDYAQCQGSRISSYNGNGRWWLRSPSRSGDAAEVDSDGGASSHGYDVYNTDRGVVPALNLTKSTIFTSSILTGELAADEAGDESSSKTGKATKTVYAPLKNGEFTLGSAVDGNGYMVYGVTDYDDGFTLTTDNLVYIDRSEGENGKVTLTYNPSRTDEATVIVVGDFGNGIEARKVEFRSNNVKSVSVSDITLNYKKSTTLKPTITADEGAEYTVKFSSSNTKVATVDNNGKVYAAKKGSATITCTVTDSNGNTVTDTCNVKVKLSFGQILITYILFGWIWY